MQIKPEFSKMQFLLTGNRFSGLNIDKTRFDFDAKSNTSTNGITLTLVLAYEIDYLEIEEQAKHLQHSTVEIPAEILNCHNPLQIIKDLVIQIQNELIRRYQASQIYKFLELKVEPAKMSDNELTDRLSRIIADYKNGKL